jgi:biopolymer transport protein ExbD
MSRHLKSPIESPIEEPQINLTPLIDVVFVILIMFILIAPLLEMEQVSLAKAPSSHKETLSVQAKSPISLHVRRDNTLWLNKEKIDDKTLVIKLSHLKKRYPQARPQLFHDEKAYFGTYEKVKNSFEEAGFSELDIVLQP